MNKIKLPNNIDIMVNNLCNMTCSHCAGLAMYDFLGTFEWSRHSHRYERWAEILEPNCLSFCGGEPYLHPDLENWFDNIRKLWPNTFIEIMTNGTKLSEKIDMSRNFIKDGNACIKVSCHNVETYDDIKKDILEILEPWKNQINEIFSDPSSPTHSWNPINYCINGLPVIKYQLVVNMLPPYHKKVENGVLHFEMGGDREKSHEKCPWKDCFTFQHGLLYKCPPVVNYTEARHQVRYEKEAETILNQYSGCDPFSTEDEIIHFINTLNSSIPVCELCAFDKQENTFSLDRKVILDINNKKKFRVFNLKQR
jgi:hypothetical protein